MLVFSTVSHAVSPLCLAPDSKLGTHPFRRDSILSVTATSLDRQGQGPGGVSDTASFCLSGISNVFQNHFMPQWYVPEHFEHLKHD